MFEGRLNLKDVKQMNFSPEEFETFQLAPDDILLNEGQSKELVGRPAMYRGEVPGACFQNTLVRFRASEAVVPQFALAVFRYYLRSGEFQKICKWTTNIAHLGVQRFATMEFPVPPINEQRRIAQKLEGLIRRVEACQARVGRVPVILKQLRESVLEAAMSGELTTEWREQNPSKTDASKDAYTVKTRHLEAGGHRRGNAAPPTSDVHDLEGHDFPRGWQIVDLRDLVDPARPITYGILKPGPHFPDGVPYVRVADFPRDQITLSTIRKTSKEIDRAFSRSRLRHGDVLLSIRGSVGRVVLVPRELDGANITQDSARLSIQPSVHPRFVYWFLRSGFAQSRMKRAIKGVAVRGINIGDVRALQVPLPSHGEQTEIVRRVEELWQFCEKIERRYERASARIHKLVPSLLSKAVHGELVPQDPDDEPASVLLKRIRISEEPSADIPKTPRVVPVRRAKKVRTVAVEPIRASARALRRRRG